MPTTFSDLDGHWAKACILELAQRNLINGYPDGSFRPNATITRAEFAALIRWSFPNSQRTPNTIAFHDVPDNYWAKDMIDFAYQAGFLSGYTNQLFKPEQPLIRLETLLALVNGLKYTIPTKPTVILRQCLDDYTSIPNYAIEAIAAAFQNRLPVNYPNLRLLKPNKNATRGEVVAFLCQALKIDNVGLLQHIGGLFVIAPHFDSASSFFKGVARVQIDGQVQAIEKRGKFILPPPPVVDTPVIPSDQFQPFFSNNKWGYKDLKNNIVIPPQFDRVNNFQEGLASVMIGNKWGWIDKTGKLAIEPQFELVEEFSEGLARVLKERVGYIDKTGKLVIPPQFGGIGIFPGDGARVMSFKENGRFSQGLAAVEIGQKWGYIDKTGQVVIEPIFEGCGAFSENLAPVNLGGQWQISSSPSFLGGGKWGYIRHPFL